MTIDDAHRPRNSKSHHRHRDGKSRHKHRNTKSRKHGGRSMTIKQFCELHGIGRSTFYDLCARGLGPKIMRIGRAVRISARANAEWILMMEAGRAGEVPALDDVKPEANEGAEASEAIEASAENEQSDESGSNDGVIERKHRAKHGKTRRHRRGKHRHRDLVPPLDAVKPESVDDHDDVAPGQRRRSHRRRKHRRRPHRDE
jgi:predicted DNA-binding transcriptional regulator AlpA